MRTPPPICATAGCTPQPDETCACGFVGPGYAFATVNGKRSCVRCGGSKEQRGKMGDRLRQKNVSEKQRKNKARFVEVAE